jgi:hypothetical protein
MQSGQNHMPRVGVERVDVDGGSEIRSQPREEGANIDVERRANVDEVGERRPLPHEEDAVFDVGWRANVDGISERRPLPHEEAAGVDVEWQANVDGVGGRRPQPREEAARVDREWLADEDEVNGQAPSSKGRHECKMGAAEETPSRITGQGEQDIVPKDADFFLRDGLVIQIKRTSTYDRKAGCVAPVLVRETAGDGTTADWLSAAAGERAAGGRAGRRGGRRRAGKRAASGRWRERPAAVREKDDR